MRINIAPNVIKIKRSVLLVLVVGFTTSLSSFFIKIIVFDVI